MPLNAVDQFIKYVKVYTTSNPDIESVPTTKRQFNLAEILKQELIDLGFSDVTLTDKCFVIGILPSNIGDTNKNIPTICFLAHLDTSPDEPGENVQPRIIKNFDGSPISYPNNKDLKLSVEDSPKLHDYIGSDLIVTSGDTLLGADDKAGIAEIMTAMSQLIESGKKHGKIVVVFSPDEEVGAGIHHLDVKSLGADFGYTFDGDELGAFEYENFNAADGYITIRGYNVHPGYAKGIMVNSMHYLPHAISLFPKNESPATTEKKEGFYHLTGIEADVNLSKINFILRDFDAQELQRKINKLEQGVKEIQKKYPEIEIKLKVSESYKNMYEIMKDHPHVIDIAREAIERTGIKIVDKAIRGGTDGAKLTFMGLPCPNIFAGGLNFHSKKEFLPVISLEKAIEVILNIVDISVEKAN